PGGGGDGVLTRDGSRNTRDCISRTFASPSSSVSCIISTNTSVPLEPCFSVMDTMREKRSTDRPSRKDPKNSTLLAAHIRRGKDIGGRKLSGLSLRTGCPSTPSIAVGASGKQRHQWKPCGTLPSDSGVRSSIA